MNMRGDLKFMELSTQIHCKRKLYGKPSLKKWRRGGPEVEDYGKTVERNTVLVI